MVNYHELTTDVIITCYWVEYLMEKSLNGQEMVTSN